MVRVNIINPRKLTDQHLVAEYLEILMLLGYVSQHPDACGIPAKYCLGKGHIKFFKNKLGYLKKRHELIKKEMRRRGFKTLKTADISKFDKKLLKDWKPTAKDCAIIKKRLVYKINLKPDYYRYYSKKRHKSFLIKLLNK